MAGEDFLSQEEIDVLLKSLGKEEAKEETATKEHKPFDLNELEKISPTRLVKLEQVMNRWIASATVELRSVILNLDSISISDIKQEKISDFVLKIPLPSAIAVLNVDTLNGKMYLVLDTRLIYTVISIILGGNAQPYKIEGKNFTKFEIKIIRNILDILIKHLDIAWTELVKQGSIKFLEMEDNPKRLITVSRNETVIVTSLTVEIEDFKGNMHLAIPTKTIEPIKDILRISEAGNQDVKKLMLHNILNIPVTMDATIQIKPIKVSELLELKVGDTIDLGQAPQEVVLKVLTLPVFRGILGESDNKKAVKIKSISEYTFRGSS